MYANVLKEIHGLRPVSIKCNGNNDWSQGEEIMKAFDEVRKLATIFFSLFSQRISLESFIKSSKIIY